MTSMVNVERALLERVCTELTRLSDLVCGIDQDIIDSVYQDVRNVLVNAPACSDKLTGDELRAMADRLDAIDLRHAAYVLRQNADTLDAGWKPIWSGEQPAEETHE